MKFMRLGCKPDVLESHGNIRSMVSEIPCDFTVVAHGVTFHLHKFPLLSKSTKLQRLATRAIEGNSTTVELPDLPGGLETFDLCVKFCYGITITLNAYNVVAVKCAAEHLEMTEAAEKGNLTFKVEVFLSSYVFQGWKDSIIALKSTRALLPWADELQVTAACIEAIASKVFVNPSKVDWSYTYTRGHGISEITQSPTRSEHKSRKRPSHVDWWIEDLAELEIDLYWRVFVAIKSKGKMAPKLLGSAIHFYAAKWLSAIGKGRKIADVLKDSHDEARNQGIAKDRQLLERIVSLLPPGKGCVSCSFLLKLLKAVVILGASMSSRKELTRRAGLQLEEAFVTDLLIPSLPQGSGPLYDVELVQAMVEHFMTQDQSPPTSPTRIHRPSEKRRTRSAENVHFVESRRSTTATHGAKLRVGKLIDSYLVEIAKEPQLDMSKFMALAKLIPEFARPVHDGLYKAIDMYLKEHSGLSKGERKRICRLLDCKKLSMEACMEAAQNEQLPLRVVVQVLFFEQVRASVAGGVLLTELPHSVKSLMTVQDSESREGASCAIDGGKWEEVQQNFEALSRDLANMKVKMAEVGKEHSTTEQEVSKGLTTGSKTKKFFSKMLTGKSLPDSTKSCFIGKEHNQEEKNLMAR